MSRRTVFSPVAWDQQCKPFNSRTSNQCVHLEVLNGRLTFMASPHPPWRLYLQAEGQHHCKDTDRPPPNLLSPAGYPPLGARVLRMGLRTSRYVWEPPRKAYCSATFVRKGKGHKQARKMDRPKKHAENCGKLWRIVKNGEIAGNCGCQSRPARGALVLQRLGCRTRRVFDMRKSSWTWGVSTVSLCSAVLNGF